MWDVLAWPGDVGALPGRLPEGGFSAFADLRQGEILRGVAAILRPFSADFSVSLASCGTAANSRRAMTRGSDTIAQISTA